MTSTKPKEIVKKICRDMAANPHIMTFSDIAQAAANGAVMGKKINSPFIGAVLGVSLEASKRAVIMSEELLKQLLAECADTTSVPVKRSSKTSNKRQKPDF